MIKRKGHFEGNLNFVSSLPLEECLNRLQLLDSETIQLDFRTQHIDAISFQAKLFENGVMRAEGDGVLRRWEGTLTRVDCDIQVHEGLMRWLLLLAGLFLMLMIILPTLFLMAADVNIVAWLGISGVFVAILIGMLWLTNYYAPIDDTPQNLLAIIESQLE